MKITLYTIGCVKCDILEERLDNLKIKYNKVTDMQDIIKIGFRQAPILKVDEEYMDYEKANKWIRQMNNTVADMEG